MTATNGSKRFIGMLFLLTNYPLVQQTLVVERVGIQTNKVYTILFM